MPVKPTPEETAAIRMLSERHRLLITLIPEHTSDEFCARVTSWLNFMLDTGLIPPLPTPAVIIGDGLHCVYCEVGITTRPGADLDKHLKDCAWRKAMERWSYAQVKIDRDWAAK